MIIDERVIDHVHLPDDLLEKILDSAPSVTDSIGDIFGRVAGARERMRAALVAAGHLRRAEDLRSVESPTVSAVDGGTAIERSLGADTALVAALGIEGLTREDRQYWHGVQYVHWQRVLVRRGMNNRDFALGVMSALELKILSGAPHEVVILDGSHITPVLSLNRMLMFDDASFALLAAELVTEHAVTSCLSTALRRPEIVALVKYDGSHELADTWLRDFACPCDDRTAMTMLLAGGEYTEPVRVGQTWKSADNWQHAHVRIAFKDYPRKTETEEEFKEALSYLNQRQIFFTYYKPHEWSPAYRIELKQEAVEDETRLARVLTAVREQVISPEVREPYPQYLADIMAKSVGGGLASLRAAVFHEMGDRGEGEYLRFMVESYRTES